jgi:hypothetical protein
VATKITMHDETSGVVIVEWILILCVIILPAVALIFEILVALEHFYSVNSWVISLPFP